MYEAIVCKALNVRKHPNADRLTLATVQGHQVIVNATTLEGDLGIFFASDGQLSHEMCMANQLYRKHPETAEPMGGFFEPNRRVRAIKLRGEKSEGFWTPISNFNWTGIDLTTLKPSITFTKLGNYDICQKYYTPQTIRTMNRINRQKTSRVDYSNFFRHFDTVKLRHVIDQVPLDGGVFWFTEKVHGTSGRTGHIYAEIKQPLNKLKQQWNKWFWRTQIIFKPKIKKGYVYVTGTRKVVLSPNAVSDTGFYSGKTFRVDIHNHIKELGLKKGETLYYEIIGFAEDGSRIMPVHKIEDKTLAKAYGSTMAYNYGCQPPDATDDLSPAYLTLIYRITQTNIDGDVVDLSWPAVQRRCEQLGIAHVPNLDVQTEFTSKEALTAHCEKLSQGNSVLDPSHIREGICIRIDHPKAYRIMKYKSFWFCTLEGIMKNTDTYVDPEEVS